MQCCGEVVEITDQDDTAKVYLCRFCGKQGPASAFPDPPAPAPEAPARWIDRVRLRTAEALDSIADFVAPK